MSCKDLRKQQPTTPENPEDRSDLSYRRNDVSSGIIYQTESYDADDEKSSGSSMSARESHPLLHSPPRKNFVLKRKKPLKPVAAEVEDIDQLSVDSSVTFVPDHNKSV